MNIGDLVLYHNKEVYRIVSIDGLVIIEDGRCMDDVYTIQSLKTKRIIGNVDVSELTKHPTLDLLYGENIKVP